DFAVSAFLDPDVGNYADDYIGTDPVRGLAYGYNADNDDEGAGGYGAAPPAFGVDFIGGPPVYRAGYYSNDAGSFGIPTNALEYYRYMTGFFREGQPWTEGGTATTPGNPPVNFVYPDTPGFYWSEPCSAFSGPCVANTPGERRVVASTLAEESRLDIGEQETFTFAMLFARGGSNFNSVTALAAASDHVQALHDSGALFTAGHTALPPALAAPAPTAPEDGAGFPAGVTRATLTWSAVPGATVYEVVVDTAAVPFQGGEQRLFAAGLSVVYPFTAEGGAAYRWRVRALALGTASPFSTSRTFTSSGFPLPGISEAAVVEVARPGGADPCAGAPADVGCQDGLGGNTVFHDGDRGADYYLTGGGSLGDIVRLSRYAYMAFPDYFEIRFTATGGYGLYFPPDNHVVRVPFELWNVRTTPDDPTDDVRMIPLINPQTAGDTPTDWTNHLTGTDAWSGRPRPVTPASDWIYWMMPDRPGGYALFETAALAFGGPGALYDPTADGDAQVEPDPYNGGACTNQGNYVSWCYRNTEPETNSYPTLGDPGSQFIYPIGRLAFADLAGDGTTPPTGTVVRFRTFQIGSVVASEPVPTGPVAALAVERVAPNPARGRALLVYAVPVAGRTVVAVYDALGRRVAVVQDGPLAAGRHEVELETAALAPGVYVVVVESRGARAARTLAVVR
ncbi:MAG TPA: T9SS type A sorting domain-containing protein, partial [Rhodothermales bacterium]|nr:T9SS type A sorting domain-containing protein [Rhodothermales bacterium]